MMDLALGGPVLAPRTQPRAKRGAGPAPITGAKRRAAEAELSDDGAVPSPVTEEPAATAAEPARRSKRTGAGARMAQILAEEAGGSEAQAASKRVLPPRATATSSPAGKSRSRQLLMELAEAAAAEEEEAAAQRDKAAAGPSGQARAGRGWNLRGVWGCRCCIATRLGFPCMLEWDLVDNPASLWCHPGIDSCSNAPASTDSYVIKCALPPFPPLLPCSRGGAPSAGDAGCSDGGTGEAGAAGAVSAALQGCAQEL